MDRVTAERVEKVFIKLEFKAVQLLKIESLCLAL